MKVLQAQQIIEIAKRNTTFFENEFQSLSPLGRIECVIYNTLICNFSAQSNYPPAFLEAINYDLFALLIGEMKLQVDETDDDKIGALIESRFAHHSKDVAMILDGGAQHDPINSYDSFYAKPFSQAEPTPVDEKTMAAFKPMLIKMSKAVLEETDQFMDALKSR